jgi:hypothetical protein
MLVKKQWQNVTVLAAFVAALLLGTFMMAPAAHAKGGDDIRVTLRGSAPYANAKGTAKYKNEGGEREFQAELENAKALAGKTVDVYANGAKVGSFRVNNLGRGEMNRNSDRGQSVPNIHAGSAVQIKTKAGVVIVSGSF